MTLGLAGRPQPGAADGVGSLSACGPRGRGCPSSRDRLCLLFSGTCWPRVAISAVRTWCECCLGLAPTLRVTGSAKHPGATVLAWPEEPGSSQQPQSCDPVWLGSSDLPRKPRPSSVQLPFRPPGVPVPSGAKERGHVLGDGGGDATDPGGSGGRGGDLGFLQEC